MAAWIADPTRFKSDSGLALYSGLGLKNDWTAGKQVKRARASKRGNRELKRALFLSARGALKGESALRKRYDARIAAGWDDRKAIRDVARGHVLRETRLDDVARSHVLRGTRLDDVARTILFVACAVWRSGKEYDDTRIGTDRNSRHPAGARRGLRLMGISGRAVKRSSFRAAFLVAPAVTSPAASTDGAGKEESIVRRVGESPARASYQRRTGGPAHVCRSRPTAGSPGELRACNGLRGPVIDRAPGDARSDDILDRPRPYRRDTSPHGCMAALR